MPLVAIFLPFSASSSGVGVQIADAVHVALIEALGVPAQDHFQIITRAERRVVMMTAAIRESIARAAFSAIQIYLARGRSLEQTQALYRRITELLDDRCAIRPEDVFINLVEVGLEDFSFGLGVAQYGGAVPPHLAANTESDLSSARHGSSERLRADARDAERDRATRGLRHGDHPPPR